MGSQPSYPSRHRPQNRGVCTAYNLGAEKGITKLNPVAWLGALNRTGWKAIFIVPWLWDAMRINCTTYLLTTHRLRVQRGVFNRSIQEAMLYNFIDVTIQRPFIYRFTTLEDVIVYFSEANDRIVLLEAIPDYEKVAEAIRQHSIRRQLELPYSNPRSHG